MPTSRSLSKIFDTDEEQKIIRLKYAALPIRRMSEWEIKKWAGALLLKINVITGWIIPEEEIMNILVDQFEKKLTEDYDMLNPEEIEYAFRKSGTMIKDWGKEMNLNLIDQVLAPYVDIRLTASANEERRKFKPPPQRILSDEEILNERRGQIEQVYQGMRRGYLPTMHPYFFEVLHTDGLAKDDETLADFFVRNLEAGVKNIYVKE